MSETLQEAIQLDGLGPIIINSDGTMSRIGKWESMSEIERERAFRLIAKRNKERKEKLSNQRTEIEGGEGRSNDEEKCEGAILPIADSPSDN